MKRILLLLGFLTLFLTSCSLFQDESSIPKEETKTSVITIDEKLSLREIEKEKIKLQKTYYNIPDHILRVIYTTYGTEMTDCEVAYEYLNNDIYYKGVETGINYDNGKDLERSANDTRGSIPIESRKKE